MLHAPGTNRGGQCEKIRVNNVEFMGFVGGYGDIVVYRGNLALEAVEIISI